MVRAPFHTKPEGIPYDILISPKMSFGTGHHQTTYLMLDYLLDMDLKGKAVLDVGSGTGVLAILAGMTSAAIVTGNTVVLKPSSDSPMMGQIFMEIMLR